MIFNPSTLSLVKEAEAALKTRFEEIDAIAYEGTRRVMTAFANHRVSDAMFAGTTGYGYNDKGRDTLDLIFAEVFECTLDVFADFVIVAALPAVTGYELCEDSTDHIIDLRQEALIRVKVYS